MLNVLSYSSNPDTQDCRLPGCVNCPKLSLSTCPLCYLENFHAHSIERHLKKCCEQIKQHWSIRRKLRGLQEPGRNPFVIPVVMSSFVSFINSTLHASGFLKMGLNWSPLKPCPHGKVNNLPKVDKKNFANTPDQLKAHFSAFSNSRSSFSPPQSHSNTTWTHSHSPQWRSGNLERFWWREA